MIDPRLTPDDLLMQIQQQSRQQLVLVDFQASWCSPCRALLPVLEKLQREFASQLLLVTIDADQHPDLMSLMAVRGLPSVLLYLHGREINRFTKALPESQIRQLLAPYVKAPEAELKQQAEALFQQSQWLAGLQKLEQVLQLPTANARDMARYCQRLMDAMAHHPELRERLPQLLDNIPADWQRDPQMQHAISRWHLLAQSPCDLARLKQNFRSHPGPQNRLALAQGLAAAEQYDQALKLLLGLLRRPCPDEVFEAGKQLLIELINTLPDRGLANQYRREWFSYLRSRELSEDPDQA
ncbi:thioredoxin family protein [Oceanobacter mangrovi]|uniref:thioredoxin family protein n=1 Tax=Oceanobacter mangrovi TaxID=2862510 RepID=UPI001C8E428C|nr:tetratricopeptide repeat protein [Oceanobacter mangrovi]